MYVCMYVYTYICIHKYYLGGRAGQAGGRRDAPHHPGGLAGRRKREPEPGNTTTTTNDNHNDNDNDNDNNNSEREPEPGNTHIIILC